MSAVNLNPKPGLGSKTEGEPDPKFQETKLKAGFVHSNCPGAWLCMEF